MTKQAETFPQQLIRKLIHADFKRSDRVVDVASSLVWYTSPRDYLAGGTIRRLLDRLWFMLRTIVCFWYSFFVIPVSAQTIADKAATGTLEGIALLAAWLGLGLFMLYGFFISLAFWRWMQRHKND